MKETNPIVWPIHKKFLECRCEETLHVQFVAEWYIYFLWTHSYLLLVYGMINGEWLTSFQKDIQGEFWITIWEIGEGYSCMELISGNFMSVQTVSKY